MSSDAWFNGLQTLGIVGSLIVAAIALRSSTRATRVSNLFQLTSFHREIWTNTWTHPELRRVLEPNIDSAREISADELLFVNLLVLNVSIAYEAQRAHAILKIEGLERDVGEVFSLPIPSTVWAELKKYHSQEFVSFVDSAVENFQRGL